ncbi:hypothetical protein F5B18DRAFT_390616 [Nemania serpens]|nr:hypothetical protein F5B18DRAFT_390616 [Nemania serpens]
MEDKKSELLQYAREYAAANKDLYELLAVPPNATQPEVHRAWRKASLKHHPDKARAFDPEIWQLFERARDVLSSAEPRAAYDSARAAALQARRARDALDVKKRAMIDDLEARERGVKRKVGDDGDGDGNGARMMTASEKRVLMERGREYVERRRMMREEAEAREREREQEKEKERMESGDGDRNNTTRKEAESRSTQPDPVRPPAATTTTTTTGAAPTTTSTAKGTEGADARAPADEYDERIADLERRLRARKADKAARKAEKKNKARKEKDDVPSATVAAADEEEDGGKFAAVPSAATAAAATTTTTTTDKLHSQPKPPIPTPRISTSNSTSGDFSSTMAKLRAAQREKERKRAEAAAAAVSTAAMALDG